MKKKILSTLLAVAMFASVAVPAFASNTSTQEGDPAKITMLEFRDGAKIIESIDIAEDEEVDLSEKLMAWEDKDTLVLDKNQIVWEIRDTQSVFTMDSEGHIVATEPKGSATVIARDGEKQEVVAKLTVNAKPNAKETYANSWKFASANYDLIFDNKDGNQESEGLTIEAVAVPDGSVLTQANKNRIVDAVRDALAEKLTVGDGTQQQNTKEVTRVTVDLSGLTGQTTIGKVVAQALALAEEEVVLTSTESVTAELSGRTNKADEVIKALKASGADSLKVTVNGEDYALKASVAEGNEGNTLVLEAPEKIENLTEQGVRTLLGLPGWVKVSIETVKVANDAVTFSLPAGVDITQVVEYDDSADSKVVFTIDRKWLTNDVEYKEGEKLGITAVVSNFGNKDDNGAKKVTAKTNLITKAAINTTKVSILPNKTIEVGETFDLAATLGWGNAKANVLKGTTNWYEAPLNNDAAVDDYAIVNEDGVVTGVKTGKNRIYVDTLGGMSAYCTVTVVPKGTSDKVDDHNAVLKVTDVTVTLGGTQWIDLYNIDEDSIVKWESSDEAVAKVVGNKENKGAKIWGLKEGTATLKLTVDGDEAATLTVTVKGAATENSKPDATGNAQTGDSLFSNLF